MIDNKIISGNKVIFTTLRILWTIVSEKCTHTYRMIISRARWQVMYVYIYRIIDSGKQGSCEIHVRNAVRIRLNPGIFKVHIYKTVFGTAEPVIYFPFQRFC